MKEKIKMKITNHPLTTHSTNNPDEVIAGSFHSIAGILLNFWKRHNLDSLADEHGLDKAIDIVLKKRRALCEEE